MTGGSCTLGEYARQEEGTDTVDKCTCADPPSPGHVRIAVFCIDCNQLIEEVPGGIEEQIARLKEVAEDMQIVRDVKELAAKVKARGEEQYDGSDSPGHTVTVTEVWGDEGFRPFA